MLIDNKYFYLTVGMFYTEKIQVVIFTMFSHRKVLLNWQTVLFIVLFLYTKSSYHLLDLEVGYSVILLNNYGFIMQEKSLFC